MGQLSVYLPQSPLFFVVDQVRTHGCIKIHICLPDLQGSYLRQVHVAGFLYVIPCCVGIVFDISFLSLMMV